MTCRSPGQTSLATSDLLRADPRISAKSSLTRSGKGNRIVIEGEGPGVDPALVKLLRESFALRRAIFYRGAPGNDLSDAWTSTYRARRIALLKLSYLAPEVIRAIFNGQQPPTLSPKRLMAMTNDLPLAWADQPRYLGFGKPILGSK